MKRRITACLLLTAGLFLCSYPLVSGILTGRVQKQAVATYEQAAEELEDPEQALEAASEYNDMLAQTKGAVVGNLQEEILSSRNYQELLDISGTGIMGTIEIPKIMVNLPVYHGTEDEVLQSGIGHLEGSALPVGGESTRCVLTGHRGLPNSKLFTRLDEMEKGDLFFLNVCGETFAYRVCRIEVIEPEEAEVLEPETGKDYVSLVTCTPYGLNTHRMIVTGERTAYQAAEKQALRAELPSVRELFFTVMPFLFPVAVIMNKVKERLKKRWQVQQKK